MMQALLIVLGVYLAACYVYGMYLALRLFTGRRLRHTAAAALPGWLIRQTGTVGERPFGVGDADAPDTQGAGGYMEQAKAA